MPWCPNCKDEYRDGFTKCADCDVELVEELPKEKVQDEEQYGEPEIVVFEKEVVLETFVDDVEFMYVASLLDQMDIPYRVRKKGGTSLEILYTSMAPIETTIYVDDKDYERAEEVLESLDAYLMEEYDDQEEDEDCCKSKMI